MHQLGFQSVRHSYEMYALAFVEFVQYVHVVSSNEHGHRVLAIPFHFSDDFYVFALQSVLLLAVSFSFQRRSHNSLHTYTTDHDLIHKYNSSHDLKNNDHVSQLVMLLDNSLKIALTIGLLHYLNGLSVHLI